MNAEIISIGSELMAGRIADTNAAYLSDHLSRLGFDVTRHVAVGDRKADILDALRQTSQRANVAVITGGIGPTPDDLTRQTVAELCGVPLVEHPAGRANLLDIFRRFGREPSPSNFVQAAIPEGGQLIPNPAGTASGFSVQFGSCVFFSLPGVPREMKGMFQDNVRPALQAMTPGASVVRCLQVYGIGESRIGEALDHLMGETRNPEVATQAREGVITVRVTATAATQEDAERILGPVQSEIHEILGEAVFSDTEASLAEAVSALLAAQPLTIAMAESCTGGLIASQLIDVPGISRYFLESAVTYSNASKIARLGVPAELIERHGAVSEEVARAMATGMRRFSGADVALATTGIAGPSGGTPEKPVGLVYWALADHETVVSEQATLTGARMQIRDRASKRALNMLRLYLIGRLKRNDRQ